MKAAPLPLTVIGSKSQSSKPQLVTLLLLSVLIMATGCSFTNKKVAKEFYASPIIVNTNDSWFKSKPLQMNLSYLQDQIDSVALKKDAVIRNELLSKLMRYSDYNYADFKTRAFTQNAAWNTTIDMASLGLSAAATIIAGPAAQAMSAADTGIKGVQSKVSERFLLSQTMILLITTMDSRRAETRTTLYQGMKTNSYDAFTIEEGVNLAMEYHNRGNLVDAMAFVQSTMGNQRTTNEVKAVEAQRKQ